MLIYNAVTTSGEPIELLCRAGRIAALGIGLAPLAEEKEERLDV